MRWVRLGKRCSAVERLLEKNMNWNWPRLASALRDDVEGLTRGDRTQAEVALAGAARICPRRRLDRRATG